MTNLTPHQSQVIFQEKIAHLRNYSEQAQTKICLKMMLPYFLLTNINKAQRIKHTFDENDFTEMFLYYHFLWKVQKKNALIIRFFSLENRYFDKIFTTGISVFRMNILVFVLLHRNPCFVVVSWSSAFPIHQIQFFMAISWNMRQERHFYAMRKKAEPENFLCLN